MIELREPSNLERAIFDNLLGTRFKGVEELRRCIADVKVATLSENGTLALTPSCKHPVPVQSTVPVEGEACDEDGVVIHVLLHVKDGYPCELEIFREDGSFVRNREVLREMTVYSLPPAPSL